MPPLPVSSGTDQVVMGMITQSELEHGMDINHQRFTRLYFFPCCRSTGAARQPGPVTTGDLVSPREGPFPLTAGLSHGIGGKAGDLRFRHSPVPAVDKGLIHRLMPHIDDT